MKKNYTKPWKILSIVFITWLLLFSITIFAVSTLVQKIQKLRKSDYSVTLTSSANVSFPSDEPQWFVTTYLSPTWDMQVLKNTPTKVQWKTTQRAILYTTDRFPLKKDARLANMTAPEKDIQSGNQEIKTLAAKLVKDSVWESDAVEKILTWVNKNVKYDEATYKKDMKDKSYGSWKGRPSQDALSTLHRRTAVCEGYAKLAAALLRSTGIPTAYLTGFAGRGDTVSLGYEAYHAWISVLYPSAGWVFSDPTWGLINTLDPVQEAILPESHSTENHMTLMHEQDKFLKKFKAKDSDSMLRGLREFENWSVDIVHKKPKAESAPVVHLESWPSEKPSYYVKYYAGKKNGTFFGPRLKSWVTNSHRVVLYSLSIDGKTFKTGGPNVIQNTENLFYKQFFKIYKNYGQHRLGITVTDIEGEKASTFINADVKAQ